MPPFSGAFLSLLFSPFPPSLEVKECMIEGEGDDSAIMFKP